MRHDEADDELIGVDGALELKTSEGSRKKAHALNYRTRREVRESRKQLFGLKGEQRMKEKGWRIRC